MGGFVGDTHSINAKFAPLTLGSGGAEVGATMLFRSTNDCGCNFVRLCCPERGTRPTIGTHQVNERFTDAGAMALYGWPTKMFSIVWPESNEDKSRP